MGGTGLSGTAGEEAWDLMKPVHLPKHSIQAPSVNRAIQIALDNSAGEINSRRIEGWDPAPFFDHLRACGWRPRQCQKYESLSLTFLNGACRWHTDPGFGPVACWLVHSDDDPGDWPQLITRHGPVDMRVGSLCIFDADQGHAWLSNAVCVMVMATVARA